ncbi:MAG: hypothetical protein VZR78_05170 [Candidatus Enteromonas sp.]|jgi:hypothetical protein|nr:hypothetical protein [Bacilli bacterium]MBQ2053152.1 hypothetical protein [Bacilli bacterium]MEE3432109.1 hypothetical protein [Candidatus Enteromonas sp.]
MKKILYLILGKDAVALDVLDSIKRSGYNGTLIETASLRHALDDTFPEDKHFFSLVNYESHLKDESLLALFVVNEESLEPLKQCIRDHTDNFRKIKGGMFSRSISDYEGTF